jgi:hypothetical protein
MFAAAAPRSEEVCPWHPLFLRKSLLTVSHIRM